MALALSLDPVCRKIIKTNKITWASSENSDQPAHTVWLQSSLYAWGRFGFSPTQRMPSEVSDQTEQLHRLFWVFLGGTHNFVSSLCFGFWLSYKVLIQEISAVTWQNQQNGMCAQRRLKSAWASTQSDQSSLSAWRNLGSLATQWVHSEDSDQTGQMPRLIWVFIGRTLILLVLSCHCSYIEFFCWWWWNRLQLKLHSHDVLHLKSEFHKKNIICKRLNCICGVFIFQFLCMDVSQDLNFSNQVSPRRTIETIKSVTPGGTLVTTTTTTTQRPQNHRIDANVDSKIFTSVSVSSSF